MLGLGLTPVTFLWLTGCISPRLSFTFRPSALTTQPGCRAIPLFRSQTSISLRNEINHRLPAQPHPIGTSFSLQSSRYTRSNQQIDLGCSSSRVGVFSSFPVFLQLSLVRVAAEWRSFRALPCPFSSHSSGWLPGLFRSQLNAIDMR